MVHVKLSTSPYQLGFADFALQPPQMPYGVKHVIGGVLSVPGLTLQPPQMPYGVKHELNKNYNKVQTSATTSDALWR